MNLASLASEHRATPIRSLPTSGTYAGFDRFGRVVDHRWYDYGASADRDRYQYGYDRASNRIYRDNLTASGKDEFYTYDGINRLTTFDRGDLNEGKTAISGTPVREEDWGLDMTGNWKDYPRRRPAPPISTKIARTTRSTRSRISPRRTAPHGPRRCMIATAT